MRNLKNCFLIASFIITSGLSLFGQGDPGINYGIASSGTYLGENENINRATDNLNIQIPLLKLPGRDGHDFVVNASYNSQVWRLTTITPPQGQVQHIWQYNPAWSITSRPYILMDTEVPVPGANNERCSTGNYRVYMGDGRVVYFPKILRGCYTILQNGQEVPTPSLDQPDGTAPSAQGSPCGDFWYFNPAGPTPYLKMSNGETLWFGELGQFATKDIDANGNVITYASQGGSTIVTDTVGRTITISGTSVSYTDTNGVARTITINGVGVNSGGSPVFHYAGAVPPSGAPSTLGSIVLANGDRYDMQYNAYSELTKITYPSGGYTMYDFDYFLDGSGEDFREVVKKSVCRDTNRSGHVGPPYGQHDCSIGEDITTFTPTVSHSGGTWTNTAMTMVNPLGDQMVFGSGSGHTLAIYSGTSTLLRTYDGVTPFGQCPNTYQQVTLETGLVSRTEWDMSGDASYPFIDYHNTSLIPANITEKREYAYGQGAPGPLVRKTTYTWLHLNPNTANQDYMSSAINNVHRKLSETVYDGSGNMVSQSTYDYDNYSTALQASGAAQHDAGYTTSYLTRGNLTTSKRWLNTTSSWLTSTNTYDDAGNALSTTDPGGHATSLSYSDNFTDGVNHNAKAYVTQATYPTVNGVSHVEKKQYYFNTGVPAASCGQNFSGACTSTLSPPQADYAKFTYDSMGRLLTTTSGNGAVASTSYSDNAGQNFPMSQTGSQSVTASLSLQHYSQIDGVGNTVQTQFTSDPDGIDLVDTVYDSMGRKSTVSNPHRAAGAPTDGTTTYQYDTLGRVTQLAPPDGTVPTSGSTCLANNVCTSYAGNTTTVTDQAGNQRRSFSDALGRLIEVDEPGMVPIPGSPGTGSVNVSGVEQHQGLSVYDAGIVHVTVGGFQAQASYAQGATSASVASGLTTSLNGGSSPVIATLNGTSITLVAKTVGVATNYSLSTSVDWDQEDFPNHASFNANLSGATLTGGTDAVNPGSSPSLNTPLVTLYTYDTLNNLTRVDQKGDQPSDSSKWRTRTFTYDSLSRLTSATNPESGTISYTYDNDDNVLTKVAPKPNQTGGLTVTTTYTYDALHRLAQKSYNDGSTATVKYGYDAVALAGCTTAPPTLTDTYPKPRRTAMCNASGATSWNHDVMGRVPTEKRTINAQTFSVNYTYNLDGSLATLQYPSGRTITYGLKFSGANTSGRVLSVKDLGNSINYVTSAVYSAAGVVSSFTNGSSISGAFSYNSRLQPLQIFYGTNTPPGLGGSACPGTVGNIMHRIFNFGLSVNDNGSVYAITNCRDTTRTQNLQYDALNRISQANSSGTTWGETFTIDAWGNLTNRGPVAGKTNYESLSAAPATPQNRLPGYTYDAAGNMTVNGSATYTYDAENRLTGTAGYIYVYDGGGNRVKKANGSTGTLYWTGVGSDALAESNLTGTFQEEYIFYNGKRVARRDVSGGAVHYYFSDHLGSQSMITNAAGTTCEQDIDYYPYGGVQQNYCSGGPAQNYKFTGKERDAESGLDNFGARHHGPTLGRFMSVDPKFASGHVSNPQTWNRYSYTLNNPLIYVDADGREVILFYRAPDPNQSSLKDYGHVFLYVRNDKTGRSGFMDYYPDGNNSAVHRSVPGNRMANHAALVIASTPQAEDRMLNKMDELTKKDPAFHANAQEIVKRSESDCVSTTEQILNAGGIKSSSRTPTGLWQDLYADYSSDQSLYSETPMQSQGMFNPEGNRLYGGGDAQQHFKALDDFINAIEAERKREEEGRKRWEQEDGGR